MEQMMPVQYKVKDGFLHVMPGDDLYPVKPNYNEPDHDLNEFEEKTIDEMRSIATNLCRSEQIDMFDVRVVSNVKPSDGHISLDFDPLAKM